MSIQAITLPDQEQRDRITTDLDSTLFVEAAAGTGKTRAVVNRIVAAVRTGRLSVDRLVAITFTIAAAGELRVRIREGLEAAARDESLPDSERQRCATAAGEVELARVDTIHGFCSSLLRMAPLEAGLPPDFETLSDLASEIDAHECFRQWFDGLDPDAPEAVAVRRGLLLGLTPARLEVVFTALNDNWDLLGSSPLWCDDIPSQVVTDARAVAAELQHAVELVPHCHTDDALKEQLLRLRPVLERFRGAASIDDMLPHLLTLSRINTQGGNQNNWARGTCADIKATLKSARSAAEDILDVTRAAVAAGMGRGLVGCVLAYAEARRRRGVVSFHDLLLRARNLVRDNRAVRRTLQARWDVIVIDEFQDTDPLQAELAFRLAAAPDAAANDWTQLELRPGVLALVGDPKQSIYRFRRADIALFSAVQRALGDGRSTTAALQVNFRSGRRIVEAVNAVFGGDDGLIRDGGDDGVQAPYIALIAHAPEFEGSVRVFGKAVDVRADEMWRAEARSTAAVIGRVLAEGWLVAAQGGGLRPCRASDICVLMPSRTNLRNMERALEDARLRYRLESGALLIATQEVRDLLNCLRAIDDPTDEVAVVATLRSPLYGCSDVDLLRWHERGGRWSYERPGAADDGRVAQALDDLRRLHALHHGMTPAALLETVIDSRLLRAAAADAWRPLEVLRRQRYVADQLNEIANTGRRTLHDAVEHLERRARSPHYDSVATGGDEEDCIRVMTVHAAKGLEFPITVLTGFGRKPQDREPAIFHDRSTGEVQLRFTREITTSGWRPLADREKAMAEAERRRLMYVAMTRASDHLIVSRFRCTERGEATDAHELAVRLAAVPRVDEISTEPVAIGAADGSRPVDVEQDPERQLAAETAWLDHRRDRFTRFGALRVTSATALAQEPDLPDVEASADVAAQRRGRGGTSLGRAVHAVLQVVDLATLDGLDGLARTQAAAEGIPERADEVDTLVRAACRSDAVRRAVQRRHWREVPVGGLVDGVTIEGFIDLLYEDDDGALVVLDYKTDAVSGAAIDRRMEHYRLQGATYALLAHQVTQRPVSRVEFVFAAAGEVRVIDDVSADVTRVLEKLAG